MEHQENVNQGADAVGKLFDLIAALRSENGCPWDKKQTPASMTVYLIEETYELVEAVLAGDADGIEDELGDVFFQLLFLVFLFQEQGLIQFEKVLARNLAKMIRRHPHVFGTDKVNSAAEVKRNWLKIKKEEKKQQRRSLLDAIPEGMPALMRAYRISERAAAAGFDWDDVSGVIRQTEEEWGEFKAEIDSPENRQSEKKACQAAVEFGDVLFSMVNVARLAGIHPETALARSTLKFTRRFRHMEDTVVSRNEPFDHLPRDEMERLWDIAKQHEAGVEKE